MLVCFISATGNKTDITVPSRLDGASTCLTAGTAEELRQQGPTSLNQIAFIGRNGSPFPQGTGSSQETKVSQSPWRSGGGLITWGLTWTPVTLTWQVAKRKWKTFQTNNGWLASLVSGVLLVMTLLSGSTLSAQSS